MLTLTIFLPLLGALALYAVPARAARMTALLTSGAALALALLLSAAFDWHAGTLQMEMRVSWIPSLGASYHVAIDGVSLPLVLLTALLTFVSVVYAQHEQRQPREFFALFLVMETGLLGAFGTLDLLLFYFFFEISLVPMYFIVGAWGAERRLEAALKFFLYTRVGSLAILLSILALYLGTEPRTFDLPAIVAARPYAGGGLAASLVLLGFVVGFAIKLPVVPLHSWLPDAHTEAPTAGSVMLAGVLLKLGGYGLLRIALPTVPDAFAAWSAVLVTIAAISAVYGAAVAMAQSDLKRLVAFSSINHMGYVMLGIAVAAAAGAPADRIAAANGATYQLVAHGVVTGMLFLVVGMLGERTGTRDLGRLSGLGTAVPVFATILSFAMFASFGLPGLAHFAAEFQIVLGALGIFPWAAGAMLLGVLVTTAMFLWVLQRAVTGQPPDTWRALSPPTRSELLALWPLIVLTVALGVAPGPLVRAIETALTSGPVAAIAGR